MTDAPWQLRDPDTLWLWVWITGSFGGHDFLLGRSVAWLKLIFFWTSIPAIIALVQLFTIRTWIKENNTRWAQENNVPAETFLMFSNWFTAERVQDATRLVAVAASTKPL